ncbi:murein biosynthesis integral membrane protein MurJ [Angustibacter sp. Root456]|uniref:murein biosynthesis integral membrane protein MurJ n=1 Tax=Angustibacter sp. Root456 TaxID=1736539 RepID=UPI000A6F71DE|nr:murein biosynthesis integral membrane protein MurJ [Angustibacter sp. Root456]
MSDSSLMRSTSVMAAGTFVSRILGFVRTSLLTGLLGVSGALAADTFITANTVPNQIYNLIASGLLNAVLVPQIVRAAKDPDGGQAFLDRLLTVSLLGIAAVTVVATLLAPAVPLVLRPSEGSWDAATVALCIAFAYWCMPQIFFYGVYTVLGQVLNARGRFGAYMWAPVANNVVAIVGLVAMFVWIGGFDRFTNPHPPASWTPGQIAGLAGTATLGVVVQALVLFWPLWRMGFRYRPRFGLRGVGLASAGKVAGWTFAAAVMGQLFFIVTVRAVLTAGAGGGPGQNSYSNAFLLFMLPHSLVTVSLVTALFTRMSESAVSGRPDLVRRDLSVGLRLTGVASVLAVAAMVAVGPELTATLFITNAPPDTRAIAAAATAMMLGLVPFSAQYLFQRAFYAFADARTPFLIQVPVVLTIAATSFAAGHLLDPQHIVVGVGLGMALGYLVGAVLSAVALHRRLGGLDGRRVLRTYVRLAAAAVPAVLVGRLIAWGGHAWLGQTKASSALVLVVGGLAVLAVYLGACRVLRVTEIGELAEPLLKRLPGRRAARG